MPVLPFSDLASERLAELHAYWRNLPSVDGVPLRGTVDPVDIPGLLPGLSLVELIGPGRLARFRLYGTEVARNFGYDLTGMTLEEADVSDERVRYWHGIYWRVADRREPMFGRDRAAVRDHVTFEWAKLPLSSDGSTVDIVLCGYDFIR